MPAKPARRTNEERKRQTREGLLKAAGEVFRERGYHKTLISDIVSRAGVAQGTFYLHFASKREIFDGLLDTMMAGLVGEFRDMTINLPTNLDEYRDSSISAIQRVAKVLQLNGELVRMFLREAPSVDSELNERLADIMEQFAALAKMYLDHAIEQGFARPCRSGLVAQALVGMALSVADNWWAGRVEDGLTVDDVVREVADFAFFGLSNRRQNRHTGA